MLDLGHFVPYNCFISNFLGVILMKKQKLLYLLVVLLLSFSSISLTSCTLNSNNIEIVSENLIMDYTCYVGSVQCPKVNIKVKNNSNSSKYCYVEINFYFKGEFACSESSNGVTLLSGDTYTFTVQSSQGNRISGDKTNWTYKIAKIHTI